MPENVLRQAVAEYAALEQRIDALNSAKFAAVCGGCGKVCCRADVCREAVSSWFLRQVSEHVHGRWWPEDWETRRTPVALGSGGCRLAAGRPIICRSYYCEPFLDACADRCEVLFYAFLSDLTNFACHLSTRVNLETLEQEQVRARAAEVLRRVRKASELLDAAEALLDADESPERKHTVALRLLCEHSGFLRPLARRALLGRLDGPV